MKIINNNIFKILIAFTAIALGNIAMEPVHGKDKKVHEIGWSSRLSSMGLNKADNLDKQYTFFCQPETEGMIHAPVWGTETYTANSGICSSAVHQGLIKPTEGGEVTVKLLEGPAFYTGSYKNKVTSQDHRTTDISFTFVDNGSASNIKLEEDLRLRQSSEMKKVMVNGVQRGVERSIEKAIFEIFK